MVALLADLGEMLFVFFGSNLKRLLQILDLHEQIGLTITAICESFESFKRQTSDDVFHYGYNFVFSCVASLGRIP